MKILIADDSDFIRANLIKLLHSMEGTADIFEAENVHMAIQQLKDIKPDILILDIRMPGGNGFDVLNTAKSENLADKIIMLTNYNYEHYKKKGLDGGADYFFDKSTEFEKIIEVLEYYFENPGLDPEEI